MTEIETRLDKLSISISKQIATLDKCQLMPVNNNNKLYINREELKTYDYTT